MTKWGGGLFGPPRGLKKWIFGGLCGAILKLSEGSCCFFPPLSSHQTDSRGSRIEGGNCFRSQDDKCHLVVTPLVMTWVLMWQMSHFSLTGSDWDLEIMFHHLKSWHKVWCLILFQRHEDYSLLVVNFEDKRHLRQRHIEEFRDLSQRGPSLKGDNQRGRLEEVGRESYWTFGDIMTSGSEG